MKTIKNLSFLYCSIPSIFFFLFYMNSIVGIVLAILLGFSLFLSIRKEKEKKEDSPMLILEKKTMIALFMIAVVWCYLGGQGNLYYQSSDWDCRNAVFRDLIYQKWPVIYAGSEKALVYYIGFWLPVAAVMKGIGFLCPVLFETEAAFFLGNILLWIWTSIGMFFVELLVLQYVGAETKKKAYLSILILVFFSGLDFIGVLRDILQQSFGFQEQHLEWWNLAGLQYSSITTCLFWVFNQVVVSWIVMLLLLQEKQVSHYLLLTLAAVSCGPLPTLGIIVYQIVLVAEAFGNAILNREIRVYLKELFSIENIVGGLGTCVMFLYYASNRIVQNGGSFPTNKILFYVVCALVMLAILVGLVILNQFYFVKWSKKYSFAFVCFTIAGVLAYLLVMFEGVGQQKIAVFLTQEMTVLEKKEILWLLVLDAGIYLVFLYQNWHSSIWYQITLLVLLIAPFFRLGSAQDFTMRFSVPAVFMMALMTMKELLCVRETKKKLIQIGLCICFIIGAMTPVTEFMRGYDAMLQSGKIVNTYDYIHSFDQKGEFGNFTSKDYEKSVFFKYFVK